LKLKKPKFGQIWTNLTLKPKLTDILAFKTIFASTGKPKNQNIDLKKLK